MSNAGDSKVHYDLFTGITILQNDRTVIPLVDRERTNHLAEI